jgi:hypothetical protein
MKHNYFFLIFLIFCIQSCNIKNETKSPSNEESLITKDTIFPNGLKEQLYEYQNALFKGDIDVAINYIYPKYIEFLAQQENISVEETFQALRNILKEQSSRIKEDPKSKSMQYSIDNVKSKVHFQNDIILTVETTLLYTKGKDKISIGDELLAISNDKGEKWKFINKNKDKLKEVLQMSYPDNIVKEILKE